MKKVIAIAAAAVITVGFAGSALAVPHLVPEKTNFTADGTSTLMKSGATVICNSHYVGHTSATGTAVVTAATYSPTAVNPNPACAVISATGLPWPVKATSLTAGKFARVSVSSPLGTCGPGTVVVAISSGGVVSYNTTLNPGACGINGSAQTTPAITTAP